MNIVIGLGNPGEKYRHHRHNIGATVVDAYAQSKGVDFKQKGIMSADVAIVDDTLLAKPTTFMNHSGISARALLKQYPEALVTVVYDDIDIPIGTIKCSFGRGAGGHNGVQSVIDHLGTKDFFRIRVGVRPVHDELLPRIAPPSGIQTYVLSNFAPFEARLLEEGVTKALQAIGLLKDKLPSEIMTACN